MVSLLPPCEIQPKIRTMNILIIGAGAIGGLYGAMLSRAGHSVSVLCRSNYETVKTKGFQIQSSWGDGSFHPDQVLRHPSEYEGTADIVMLCTKVYLSIDWKTILKPVISSGTTILCLQNGIHIESPLVHAFPNQEIISGLAFVYSSQFVPGTITHTAYGRILLGAYPSGESKKGQDLVASLKSVGVPASYRDHIQAARWEKLIWNASFNPLSVINGEHSTLELLENPESRQRLEALMKEVLVLAEADGCALDPSLVEKNIVNTEGMPAYDTSMLLDAKAKRPLESEAILGNAVRFAQSKGILVPELKKAYEYLRQNFPG